MRIRAPPVLAGLRSAGADGLKILDVRRLRSRQVSKISVCSEHRKVPVAKRRDPDCGSPFFSLGFFGEAKKSKSPAAATERHRTHRSTSRSKKKASTGSARTGTGIRFGIGRFRGRSTNSPSLWLALRVLRFATQRNCDPTPKTSGSPPKSCAVKLRSDSQNQSANNLTPPDKSPDEYSSRYC